MRAIFSLVMTATAVMGLASCSANDRAEPAIPILDQATVEAPTERIPIAEGFEEINGTILYYKLLGTGAPIVFIHGGGGSHRYFLPFVEELAKTYQLVFYDQRGTGLSDTGLDMSAVTINQFADDLEALRAALGFEEISIVGHSWGAITAITYGAAYAEHLDRLVLVNSIPVSSPFLVDTAETLRRRAQQLSPEALQLFTTTCNGRLAKLSAEELAACNGLNATLRYYEPEMAERMDMTIDESTARNSDFVQTRLRSDLNRTQLEIQSSLAAIKAETLIMHGAFDPIPAASSEFLQEEIPMAQFVLLAESGHFPFVEQPELFTAEIAAFLQR